MTGFYQCNGCLDFFPPKDLKPAEVCSIVVGETYYVILCDGCIQRYTDWEMMASYDTRPTESAVADISVDSHS